MKRIFSRLFVWSIALRFVSSAVSVEAPPRIAIIGEGEAAAFGDLLATHLSAATGCQLVERAELSRIADEAALAGLSMTERPLRMARLAKADALLFASVDTADTQRPLLVLRLATTTDGIVRHAFVLPWLPKEIPTNARLAAAQLEAPVQRLQENRKARPLMVSLLGLRATVNDSKLSSFETTLNTLLAHRLAAQPGLVLLERWRMDDLVFERSLRPLDPPALATGSTLLDGSFAVTGTALELRLRWRTSETGDATVRTIQGSTSDVGALVESIVGLFAAETQRPAASIPWQPQAEAGAFAELGDWLARHGVGPEAAQAFESAVALGNKASKTLVGRTQAYALCAYPEYLTTSFSLGADYQSYLIRPQELPYRLAAAIRAINCAVDLLESPPAQSPSPGIEEPAVLGIGVFHTAVRVLRAVQDARQQVMLAAQVRPVRSGVLQLVSLLDASNRADNYLYLIYKAGYAACWAATPADALAHYRAIVSPAYNPPIKRPFAENWAAGLRQEFNFVRRHGPFLDREATRVEDRLETGIARLMDWESTDNSAIKPLWARFIQELRASPDLQIQADGFSFDLAAHQDPANRARLLDEITEFLWTNRQRLADSTGAVHETFGNSLSVLTRGQEHAKAQDRLMSFLVYELDHSPWIPSAGLLWIDRLLATSADANLDETEARLLFAALDRYSIRVKGDVRWTPAHAGSIASDRDDLLRIFPGLATENVNQSPEALIVSRLWNPARHLSPPNLGPGDGRIFDGDRLVSFEDRIWLFFTLRGVVSLNPATLESAVTSVPKATEFYPFPVEEFLPTKETLWISNFKSVWRRPRSGGDWERVDVPESQYTFRLIQDKLLIVTPAMRNLTRTGMSIADVTSGEARWLVSSRRRPPEHPLDGVNIDGVHGFFAGPKGEPWVALYSRSQGLSVLSLAHAQAPIIFFPKSFPKIKTDNGCTLVLETWYQTERGSSVSGVWLIDPAKEAPQLLLHDPARSLVPDAGTARWPLPEALAVPAPGRHRFYSPVMHGEELWILKGEHVSAPYTGSTNLELIGLRPGQPASARIPLKLVATAEDFAALQNNGAISRAEHLTMPSIKFESVVSTSYGIAIGGDRCKGIWIVPWQDIHEWMNAHP